MKMRFFTNLLAFIRPQAKPARRQATYLDSSFVKTMMELAQMRDLTAQAGGQSAPPELAQS